MEKVKNQYAVKLAKNSVVDKGDGVIEFEGGLVITDGSEQRNGTTYDIASMDLSEFSGLLTVDHDMSVHSVVAKVSQPIKKAGKVIVKKMQFAVNESPIAIFTYNMLKGGFVKDFSIETIGPWPDDDGVYKDSKLIGLSAVVIGNNKSARINEVVLNSLDESKQLGLDTNGLENLYYDKLNSTDNEMKKEEIKKETGAPEVDASVNDAEQKATTPDTAVVDAINGLVSTVESLNEKVMGFEKNLANAGVEEPKFNVNTKNNELDGMDWKQRTSEQIINGWNWLKAGSPDAQAKLAAINEIHLKQLKEKGMVNNQITIGDMGNLVTSPELLTEIEGHRSDFSAFLSLIDYRETLSLQMAWLERSGDIDMQEVEMCDDEADGNLKPISEYGATPRTANLKEVAAVTPVCNAATRFLAVDLLTDVAQGYRTDFDRKKAQIVIARMQQAINATGNSVDYDASTSLASLQSWIETWGEMQEEIMNGVFVMSQKSYAELLNAAVGAGISGPLGELFTTGNQSAILGSRIVLVPNELLPTLGTSETRSFVVEGATVTIADAVMYFDPSTIAARTSGGLQYDLSTEAAYEVEGETRSAFQRNELVLRGSMFRNAAVKDRDKVVGLGTVGLS